MNQTTALILAVATFLLIVVTWEVCSGKEGFSASDITDEEKKIPSIADAYKKYLAAKKAYDSAKTGSDEQIAALHTLLWETNNLGRAVNAYRSIAINAAKQKAAALKADTVRNACISCRKACPNNDTSSALCGACTIACYGQPVAEGFVSFSGLTDDEKKDSDIAELYKKYMDAKQIYETTTDPGAKYKARQTMMWAYNALPLVVSAYKSKEGLSLDELPRWSGNIGSGTSGGVIM